MVVHVKPHAVFGREGDNLTVTVPVTFPEAVLGADIKVPVLGGLPVTVKLPAGQRQRPHHAGARQGRAARKTAAAATCWSPSRWPCRCKLSDAAKAALESFRAATADHDVRAELLSSAKDGGA